jgi:hypothetical protein
VGLLGGFPVLGERGEPGSGWLPADAGTSLGREPACKSGAGVLTYGSRIVASSSAT